MVPHSFKSLGEQAADYLREQILRGAWVDEIPGAPTLATELGIDHRVIITAFSLLEKEGLLTPQGAGRRRKITLPTTYTPPTLRLQILTYEKCDQQLFYMVDLQHRLLDTGHMVSFAPQSLHDLGMEVKRVTRMVEKVETDAWVVFAGSREVLNWFAGQPVPSFAFFGRRRGIPIAGCGPDKAPAMREAVRRLVSLGHRRIVLLAREERRKPSPGYPERSFLEEMEKHGIPTGPYNLPDWANDIGDFYRCLNSLFLHTPPTALLIDEYEPFIAAQLHLAQKGILAPRNISLICTDPNPAFSWCRPTTAHIQWDADPLITRIMSWANHVARGKEDRRQSFTKAHFIEGDTIGPAPR